MKKNQWATDFNAMLCLSHVDICSVKLPPRRYPAHSLLKQVHTAVLYDLYHTNVLYHWKIAKYVATDGVKH